MVRSSGTRAQRIPMTSLKALTLYDDRETTYRRTSPVPQLTCKGKACRQYRPDAVQCTAVGEDGAGGLEWSCTAELPRGVRFGAVTVSCEGWDGPDDPYILKALVSLASLFLFLYAIYRLAQAVLPRILAFFRSGSAHRPRSWFGGGWGGGPNGGGGGPGGRGPPPPYTSKSNSSEGSGWRPGFWTGALAGALGGEAAARMRGQRGYQPGYGYGRPNTGFRQNYGLREPDDWDRGVGGSGSSGSSGAMRQSTGFGGTRNR